MIGLDTNVVVRLLVGDDLAQQRVAREYLALRSSPNDPAWIDRIVAVETIWVLERSYGFSRSQIATAFEKLLDTAELAFEDHELVRRAVTAYRRGAGFADALLSLANETVGCTTTITFDSRAAKQLGQLTLLASERKS
ncbi:MAG: type II toxin-antitoxin system VapC family toxin [Candidatus Cybelea sp.]